MVQASEMEEFVIRGQLSVSMYLRGTRLISKIHLGHDIGSFPLVHLVAPRRLLLPSTKALLQFRYLIPRARFFALGIMLLSHFAGFCDRFKDSFRSSFRRLKCFSFSRELRPSCNDLESAVRCWG